MKSIHSDEHDRYQNITKSLATLIDTVSDLQKEQQSMKIGAALAVTQETLVVCKDMEKTVNQVKPVVHKVSIQSDDESARINTMTGKLRTVSRGVSAIKRHQRIIKDEQRTMEAKLDEMNSKLTRADGQRFMEAKLDEINNRMAQTMPLLPGIYIFYVFLNIIYTCTDIE